MTKCVRVRIEGRVQGVGFRAWVERQAIARGLDGYVRNRRDGGVEAVFSGVEAQVDDMIRACQNGSPSSRVDRVFMQVESTPATNGFRVVATV